MNNLGDVFNHIFNKFDFANYFTYGKSEYEILAFQEMKDELLKIMKNVRSLNEYAMLVERQKGNIKNPKLRLSTIHKSKGLEADDVFIVAINSTDSRTPDEDCVYYVAITRARENLWVSGSKSGTYFNILKNIYENMT